MINIFKKQKVRTCVSIKSFISVALLVGFTGTVAANEVHVKHMDSTDIILAQETVSFSSKSEVRMFENFKREFAEARGKHFANDAPGGKLKYISACERVLLALSSRGHGEIKLRGNVIQEGDKFEIEIPIKLNGPNIENILIKVCKGGGVDDSTPDNAASQTALVIHGGYTCHDVNGVEEGYGKNPPNTGSTCPQ